MGSRGSHRLKVGCNLNCGALCCQDRMFAGLGGLDLCAFESVFNFVYMCVWTNEYSSCRGQKRVSNVVELELQGVVSYPMWVLATELRSSWKNSKLALC